jgi:aryl-alcohol dehydrogenase-like predicted oxidoreductase
MAVRQRTLGRTGQSISEIGFGCGNQAGLLVRGEPHEQVSIIAHAIELGVTYFDTAAAYGNGQSEQNLGRALRELQPRNILVGTKLQFGQPDMQAGPARIKELFEASLARLGRDSVDVLFYHGRIQPDGQGGDRSVGVSDLLGPLLDAYRGFRREGRVRFLGFTGLGDTASVLGAIQPDAFDVFHCYFSAVNPSAGFAVPAGLRQQDLGGLMQRATGVGMGVLAIRVLAAGALAGEVVRHPLASREGGALIAGVDYDEDARQAERLRPIANELGITLPELGIRFGLSKPEVACALVGVSDASQLEQAVRAAEAGPLPAQVVERVVSLAGRV